MEANLTQYQIDAIASGYPWECDCGELHRTREQAVICRKCRQYCMDYFNRSNPIDLRTLKR